MAKAVGLDIGSRAVKLVEIEGSPKKFRITKFLARDIPGEGGAAEGDIVTETVATVLREAKALRDTLVAAVDSGSVVIREILVPFLEEDQIRRVLRFEAEAHLHSFAIEDVVVDYLKVGEVRDQSKILIFAAPKTRLRERLAQVNGAGVDPMHLGLDLAALFVAAQATGAFERHPNCVLLDVGAVTTQIVFVTEGKLKSVRSLRTGSESLTRVLSQDLAVDQDSARERAARGDARPREDDLLAFELPDDEDAPETRKSAARLENEIVVQRQDDFLGRIHRETTRSMAGFGTDAAATAIYLTGGASLARGLVERLEERFGKPVLRLDFLGDGDHAVHPGDREKVNAQLGVALGCALRGLGYEGAVLEFRREELRYTRRFDLIKVTLACTVSLVFLLLFLTAYKVTKDLEATQVTLQKGLYYMNQSWVDKTKKRYQEVLGDVAKRLPADTNDPHLALPTWMNQLGVMHKHITNELGYDVRDIPLIRPALQIWNDVFEKLSGVRDQLGFLRIDDIDVKQKLVKISGLIGDRSLVDVVRGEIARIGYVESVELGPTEFDKKTEKIKFSVTANLGSEETK